VRRRDQSGTPSLRVRQFFTCPLGGGKGSPVRTERMKRNMSDPPRARGVPQVFPSERHGWRRSGQGKFALAGEEAVSGGGVRGKRAVPGAHQMGEGEGGFIILAERGGAYFRERFFA